MLANRDLVPGRPACVSGNLTHYMQGPLKDHVEIQVQTTRRSSLGIKFSSRCLAGTACLTRTKQEREPMCGNNLDQMQE